MSHPDFAVLTVSWELALQANGDAENTVRAYQNLVRSLAGWLAEHHPEVGPAEFDRRHVRGFAVLGRWGPVILASLVPAARLPGRRPAAPDPDPHR